MLTVMTGLGLSMDAFSLAILYGTNEISKKRKIILSILVGLNHLIFPLIGNFLGQKIFSNDFFNINIISMIVFCVIGLEMIISSEKDDIKELGIVEILLFSFSVSIDSFIIGVTYNLPSQITTSSLIYMLFSGFLTFIGLIFGQKLKHKFGNISKKIGGLLIILVGLYTFFA